MASSLIIKQCRKNVTSTENLAKAVILFATSYTQTKEMLSLFSVFKTV